MKTEIKKFSHGGARKGAGRKKGVAILSPADKRKKYTILLSDAEKQRLDELCGGLTPSAFIRQKLGL